MSHLNDRRIRSASIALLSAALSLGLIFDRLLFSLGTALPGSRDGHALALWHTWWVGAALSAPDRLVVNTMSGAPYAANHAAYLPVLQGAVYAGLRAVLSPALAFNGLLVLSAALTHAAVYRLLRSRSAPVSVSALGAALFVLSGWYVGALAQADLITASLWLLPVALLTWDRWLARPTAVRAGLVVVVLYAAVLAGLQHSAWMAALWLPYAVWTLVRGLRAEAASGHDALRSAAMRHLPVAGLAFTVLLLVYPLPALVRAADGLAPPLASTAWIPALEGRRSIAGALLRTGPAIYAAALAAFATSRTRSAGWFWLAAGSASLIFALGILPGPLRMITGALALPFQPAASREVFFGPALLALLIYSLTATGVAPAREQDSARLGWQAWIGAAAAIALTLGLNPALLRAFPLEQARVEPFYLRIAHEPEDYILLEYPFGLLNTQDGFATGSHAWLARYAAWHGKRTVSGVAPYYEPAVHARLTSTPFLSPGDLDAEGEAAASVELAAAINEWRIGYVVAHSDLLTPDAAQAVDLLAEASGALCPRVQEGSLVIYRARWHPAGCEVEP